MDVSSPTVSPMVRPDGYTSAPLLPCSVGPPLAKDLKEKAPAESWGAVKLPNYRGGMKSGGGFIPNEIGKVHYRRRMSALTRRHDEKAPGHQSHPALQHIWLSPLTGEARGSQTPRG